MCLQVHSRHRLVFENSKLVYGPRDPDALDLVDARNGHVPRLPSMHVCWLWKSAYPSTPPRQISPCADRILLAAAVTSITYTIRGIAINGLQFARVHESAQVRRTSTIRST